MVHRTGGNLRAGAGTRTGGESSPAGANACTVGGQLHRRETPAR